MSIETDSATKKQSQINLRPSPSVYMKVVSAARISEKSVPRYVLDVLEAHLDGLEVEDLNARASEMISALQQDLDEALQTFQNDPEAFSQENPEPKSEPVLDNTLRE